MISTSSSWRPRAGAQELRAVVRGERQALLGELHALRGIARDDDPLAALLTEGAALQMEARLRLLDLAEHDARALAGAAEVEERGELPRAAAAIRRTR